MAELQTALLFLGRFLQTPGTKACLVHLQKWHFAEFLNPNSHYFSPEKVRRSL